MKGKLLHRLFLAGVGLKGADGVLETLGGLALAILGRNTLTSFVGILTRGELSEDPHDFIASHLLALAHSLSVSEKNFYALYLLGHGLLKIFLVAGLLRNKMWAYPAGIIALGGFIGYLLYRFLQTHSPVIAALTLLDAFIVAAIWLEYRFRRRNPGLRY